MTDTRAAASGKWHAILQLFVSSNLLNGKHQDCPICNAKGKFRFTDYKGNGEWICTHGAGDGFDLLMEVNRQDFAATAKEIDNIIDNNDLDEVFRPEVDYESRRKNLNRVWAGATGMCHYEYLKSRGIDTPAHSDLRGHDSLWNTDTGRREPAMVSLIRNKKGEPISIHRTFFNPRSKKIMPPTENILGGGIRLGGQHDCPLVVGEGIETTLAGMGKYGNCGIAAISANGMEALIIPKVFKDITILSDHDRSFTGQKAAFTLARKLDQEGRDVFVVMSPFKGEDFLDFSGSHLWEWNNVR